MSVIKPTIKLWSLTWFGCSCWEMSHPPPGVTYAIISFLSLKTNQMLFPTVTTKLNTCKYRQWQEKFFQSANDFEISFLTAPKTLRSTYFFLFTKICLNCHLSGLLNGTDSYQSTTWMGQNLECYWFFFMFKLYFRDPHNLTNSISLSSSGLCDHRAAAFFLVHNYLYEAPLPFMLKFCIYWDFLN